MNEPTDLELMMYADGELDPARAAEVARFLGENPSAGAGDKLFGLSVLSAHVQAEADRAATAGRADDIVAGVLAAIRAEQDEATGEPAAAKTNGHARVAEVLALSAAKKATGAKAAPTSAPANDNARLIFGLAGVAAAAAIALGIWGNGANPTKAPESVGDRVAMVGETPEPALSPEGGAEKPIAAQIESNKKAKPSVQDDTPAVAVAAVDFGTKTGAVYYVPSDSPGSTTTVVWVTDE